MASHEPEQEVGFELPQAFKDLYAWRNGRDLDSFQDSYMLMAGHEIVHEWSFMWGMAESGEIDGWSTEWIPFMSSGGGDFICIDMGVFQGRRGQILEWARDDYEQQVLYESFYKWLETFVESLKKDVWRLTREEDVRPRNRRQWKSFHKKGNPGYPVTREFRKGDG